MLEQQGVDALSSAVSEVLPEAYKLNTGYGLIGRLVTKGADKDFWKQAISQAVTFGAFSVLHEIQSPHEVRDRIKDVLDQAAEDGLPKEQAAELLARTMQESAQAQPDQAEASQNRETPQPAPESPTIAPADTRRKSAKDPPKRLKAPRWVEIAPCHR